MPMTEGLREGLVVAGLLLASTGISAGAGAVKDNLDESLAKNPDYTRSLALYNASRDVQSAANVLGPHPLRYGGPVVAANPNHTKSLVVEAVGNIGDTLDIDDRLTAVVATLPGTDSISNSAELTVQRDLLHSTSNELSTLSASYRARVPVFEVYARDTASYVDVFGRIVAGVGIAVTIVAAGIKAGINHLPSRYPRLES